MTALFFMAIGFVAGWFITRRRVFMILNMFCEKAEDNGDDILCGWLYRLRKEIEKIS